MIRADAPELSTVIYICLCAITFCVSMKKSNEKKLLLFRLFLRKWNFRCFFVAQLFAFTEFARSHHTFANETKLCHVASISCISCAVWCDFLFFGSNIFFYATNARKSSNEKILIQLEYVWWAFVHFIFIFFSLTKSSKIYYKKLNSSFRLKKILFKKFFY